MGIALDAMTTPFRERVQLGAVHPSIRSAGAWRGRLPFTPNVSGPPAAVIVYAASAES